MSKILFTTVILLVFAIKSFAITAEGYIITLHSDTIYGQIQLSRFNQVTGGLILNGIEEESFHSRVVFKIKGESKFHTYFPEMISEFGFIYKTTTYIYEQVTEKRKSIFQSEKPRYWFMRLLYDGTYEVTYNDIRIMQNPGLQSNKDRYLKSNSFLYRFKPKEKNQSNGN